MKKAAAAAAAILLAAAVFPAVQAHALSVRDGELVISYELTDEYSKSTDGENGYSAIITGISGASGDIVLPDIIEDGDNKYPAAAIGASVFFSSAGLKTATLPASLIEIGSSAVAGCMDMEQLVIPASVKKIGDKCFINCIGLKTADLGGEDSQLAAIPESCFSNCVKLEEVNIPPSVTEIRREAFFACPELKIVEVPPSVTGIGENALGMTYDIRSSSVVRQEDFLILGSAGSAAESYSSAKGIAFLDRSLYEMGDVNKDGMIDSSDASDVLQEYAYQSVRQKSELDAAGKYLADINNDGQTDATDASDILEIYADRATS